MRPAIGGNKKVLTRRTSVNFQPRSPTSMGRRATAHIDQDVRKATVVAKLAPERKGAVSGQDSPNTAPATYPTRLRLSPLRRVTPILSRYSSKGTAYLRVVPSAVFKSPAVASPCSWR